MNRYRLPNGAMRHSWVNVDRWIPDPSALDEVPADERLALAIDYAERAEALQAEAHTPDDADHDCALAVDECSRSDCWISHLDAAMAEHPAHRRSVRNTRRRLARAAARS